MTVPLPTFPKLWGHFSVGPFLLYHRACVHFDAGVFPVVSPFHLHPVLFCSSHKQRP